MKSGCVTAKDSLKIIFTVSYENSALGKQCSRFLVMPVLQTPYFLCRIDQYFSNGDAHTTDAMWTVAYWYLKKYRNYFFNN
jgi:hypothetical protein